jgi:hypothetical protein
MTMLDITDSLIGFGTFGTPISELREIDLVDKEKEKGEREKVEQTTSIAVPNVPAGALPRDQAAWLPIARQVLAGEFDDADGSTLLSLTIGLRGITHPVCRHALERLRHRGAKPGTL